VSIVEGSKLVELQTPTVPAEVDVSLDALHTATGEMLVARTHRAAPDAGTAPPRVVRELREPLDEIVQSLQRLSLRDTADLRPTPDSPRLLNRARILASELRGVVDTLIGPAGDGTPGERRTCSETLSVIAAFDDAAAASETALAGRHVTLACPPRLTATTDAASFCGLLSLLLCESARDPGEVHAFVALVGSELVIGFDGLRTDAVARDDLDRISSLAARLGGHLEGATHPERGASLRLHLPQQRAQDGASLPLPHSASG